jgi:hypothetical protein
VSPGKHQPAAPHAAPANHLAYVPSTLLVSTISQAHQADRRLQPHTTRILTAVGCKTAGWRLSMLQEPTKDTSQQCHTPQLLTTLCICLSPSATPPTSQATVWGRPPELQAPDQQGPTKPTSLAGPSQWICSCGLCHCKVWPRQSIEQNLKCHMPQCTPRRTRTCRPSAATGRTSVDQCNSSQHNRTACVCAAVTSAAVWSDKSPGWVCAGQTAMLQTVAHPHASRLELYNMHNLRLSADTPPQNRQHTVLCQHPPPPRGSPKQ